MTDGFRGALRGSVMCFEPTVWAIRFRRIGLPFLLILPNKEHIHELYL